MAYTGPESKTVKHGRTPRASGGEWTDVVDELHTEGGGRELPKLPGRKKWRDDVLDWWSEVRVMPHTRLWRDPDWRFAATTARIMQQVLVEMEDGKMNTAAATELRRREDLMGYTAESRRKLRIRYVPAAELDQAAAVESEVGDGAAGGGDAAEGPVAGVTQITSVKDRKNRPGASKSA